MRPSLPTLAAAALAGCTMVACAAPPAVVPSTPPSPPPPSVTPSAAEAAAPAARTAAPADPPDRPPPCRPGDYATSSSELRPFLGIWAGEQGDLVITENGGNLAARFFAKERTAGAWKTVKINIDRGGLTLSVEHPEDARVYAFDLASAGEGSFDGAVTYHNMPGGAAPHMDGSTWARRCPARAGQRGGP